MRNAVLFTLLGLVTLGASPVKKLVLAYAPKESHTMYLVGAYDRARGWRGPEQLVGAVGTRNYRIYTLNGDQGEVEGGQPREGPAGVEGRLARKLHREALLVNGDRPDLVPITPGDASDPALNAALTTFLRSQGVAISQAEVTQHVKVDLDGDGAAESVACCRHLDVYSDVKKPVDYSLVAVVRGARVVPLMLQTARLQADLPWEHYELLTVANMDGAGPNELAILYHYYEGGGVVVFEGSEEPKVLVRGDWGL
ncbi:MAG: hypothetical protein AB1758_37475 [Candidatus Eremiobacterota bacterium]